MNVPKKEKKKKRKTQIYIYKNKNKIKNAALQNSKPKCRPF
jgi:hypothetical protein